MAKTAVQYKAPAHTVLAAVEGRVIDIRTRKPWRPRQAISQATDWTFLLDVALTFTLMLIGAWLFLKMRGE